MHYAARAVKLLALALIVLSQSARAEESMKYTFFFTPGCRMCKETKIAVRAAEAKFGAQIKVEWVDLSKNGTESATRLFEMLNKYGESSTPSLSFFTPRKCLAGEAIIRRDVISVVAQELENDETVRKSVDIDRMGLFAISTAALADGVNPCAFATIVLLVSMMATARKTRKETLLIGGVFTLSVFVTYFFIGLVLFEILARLKGFLVVSDIIYYLAFIACVIFGLLSFWDATLAWRGHEAKSMLLKVPEKLRNKMDKATRVGVRSKSLILGAAGAGVVVSLLESACTGQVYFPVIAGLVRTPGTRLEGVIKLAWYNFLFVLPLIGVLGLAVFGVESKSIASWGRRNWGLTKFLLACVFIAMAVWMFSGLTWPPGSRS